MTDIDRRLRHVDRVHAPDLWDRIEIREPRPSIPPGHRGRILSILLALVLSAAGVFLAARAFISPSDRDVTSVGLQGSNTLDVPPRGEASPEFLADGRPVWVVHHRDDSVSVVDAFSTHRPFGIEELVGWCQSGHYFYELAHGGSFNDHGQYLDGPPSADLAYYQTEVMDGRIRVGSIVIPRTRSEHPRDGWQGGSCDSPGAAPGYPPLRVHHIPTSAESASPAAAVRAGPKGWIKLHGVLLVRRNEPTYLCASVEGDACSSSAVVEGIEAQAWLRGGPIGITENGELIEPAKEDGRRRIVEEGQWIARVEGDRLTELTRIDTRVDVTER